MAVSLTASKTITGAQASDLLAGGSTGVDMGTVANNAFSTVQNLFLRHNGLNIITSVAIYIQAFTGSYGGAYTPSADYTRLLQLGDFTPTSHGLQFEENWQAAVPFSTFYQIKTGAGDSFANRRTIPASTMAFNNSGTPIAPSAAITGQIGEEDNAVLGDRAYLKYRISIPSTEVDGGIRQFDLVAAFSYTN